ncbi:M61 family metallopeptidase [Echinicola vietnamensis]|uniref:Putative protease with the C-terminal PDZ domain n=1 Tax=Echinicola vietnamensis (strain DSM 17526 / LMG 23754 / KMM 6221) TaxID=926556 RepID=L0FYE7_ECHVK|nr:M61 family metallopeptidase [Echinicola vietnamensis]AGA78048.1 putative protease with the C-terminal PDZ domain [Echinicola vietnamensis DSM 17526]
MEYLIYRNNPVNQFVQIELSFDCESNTTYSLQLPSWRPGRYEITNYAQKIRAFQVNHGTETIHWQKETKDLWTFKSVQAGRYRISYEFHAAQMDAGGSWSDDEQLYINFINCCFAVKDFENAPVKVQLNLPEGFEVATALPKKGKHLYQATDYQHLVDSPLMASASLKHYSYQVKRSNFHLWFQGEIHFDVPQLIRQFEAFTEKQVDAFGEFPAEDYHFLYQLLPYKHYHGVEHQFSTVITFGPADSLKEKSEMDEFFGVSCHELYHFWNVCRIRPKPLLPYDFSKEVYFDTGIVAEGVTTYMGDLFLLKSGYFSLSTFLDNMQKQLAREFGSFGWQNQAISASSWDLWLDGYKAGIPERKVSIYNRGALISTILDLMLLDQGSSLHQVMKIMWERFGKPQKGYTMQDFTQVIAACYGNDQVIQQFFEKYVQENHDIFPLLCEQMESVNISIKTIPHTQVLAANWGIQALSDGTISKVHPDSPAYKLLMQGDKIITINHQSFSPALPLENEPLQLEIDRFGRKLTPALEASTTNYYLEYLLIAGESNPKRKRWVK